MNENWNPPVEPGDTVVDVGCRTTYYAYGRMPEDIKPVKVVEVVDRQPYPPWLRVSDPDDPNDVWESQWWLAVED